MIVTSLIALYIASVLYLRNWIKIAHSKYGKYSASNTDFMDFFCTFMPVLNTLMCVAFFDDSPYKNKQYRKPINYNKIFGVKK